MRSLYKLLVFGALLDRTATTWVKRLLIWLELFEQDFTRQSQRGALQRCVSGLLSDSRRKSMQAMWARLTDPGSYRAFQHFITHAAWDAETLRKRLRARVPERTGTRAWLLGGISEESRWAPRAPIQDRGNTNGGSQP